MNPVVFFTLGQVISLAWAFWYTRRKYGKMYPQDIFLIIFGSFAWPIAMFLGVIWWLSSKMEKYFF